MHAAVVATGGPEWETSAARKKRAHPILEEKLRGVADRLPHLPPLLPLPRLPYGGGWAGSEVARRRQQCQQRRRERDRHHCSAQIIWGPICS
ncbi:unnamed protein product, partial [Pylaiella littoralis]